MRNKIFTKIIITTLLVTFLTFNVGRVTRVSAVGTTAAIAGTAFLLTGAIYMSYIALTNGEMLLPASENLNAYLTDVGRKVSQFPSGAAAYQEMYQGLLRDPTANVIHDVWTWTEDKIKSWVNDFASVKVNENIASYTDFLDVSDVPINGFAYPDSLQWTPEYFARYGLSAQPFSNYGSRIQYPTGTVVAIDFPTDGVMNLVRTTNNYPVRNLLKTNGKYIGELYVDGNWVSYSINGGIYYDNRLYGFTYNMYAQAYAPAIYTSTERTYPLFPFDVIHDQATDEDLPLVIPESERLNLPSWVDPDNNNRPIIPWVPIPQLPVNVTPPTGYIKPQWGFNLQDLLDKLEDLAGLLIDIGGIASLINEFAGLHGDEYYIVYNDGDTNYYTYYQPTVYDNDTNYVTYNIDLSEQEDIIPVNLNEISKYTQNRYLEQIKNSAIAGSSILRDLAVFWYDVDPEVTYIVLGCCILVLIGAFTGKLGHS